MNKLELIEEINRIKNKNPLTRHDRVYFALQACYKYIDDPIITEAIKEIM